MSSNILKARECLQQALHHGEMDKHTRWFIEEALSRMTRQSPVPLP